jgi:diguanylate cyclase (GGDEF)-like protein/PAS domain S-box-containing protein
MILNRLTRLVMHKRGTVDAVCAIVRGDGGIATVARASESSALMTRLEVLAGTMGPRVIGQEEVLVIADPGMGDGWSGDRKQGDSSFTACVAAALAAGDETSSDVLCVLTARSRAWSDKELDSLKSLVAGSVKSLKELTLGGERPESSGLRLLTAALDAASDVILVTEADPRGPDGPKVVYVNPAFSRMTGYAPEEIIGKTPRILQGPGTDQATRAEIREHLSKWKPVRVEVLNYRKDGTPFWAELDIRPVADADGWYTHWVAVQRDITERRIRDDALRRNEADLAQAYEATIEGWARALDLRDHETEGHSRRVTEMTVQLARAMGVSDEEIVHIRRGALLHDIGKMGIPDGILRKPGPLTADEWRVMQEHPRLAKEMIESIDFLGPALDIPYGHHERWDGSGYPQGLRGEEIPLAARIFAAVDIWDALSHDRPYRLAWPKHKVIEQMKSEANTSLDPNVVAAFIKLFGDDEGLEVDPGVSVECAGTSGAEQIPWLPAPIPANEASRLNALCRYEILDSRPETAFDDLVRVAAWICQTPMATITFVDLERQWFKARVGVNATETPRDVSFCGHTILKAHPMIVPDARRDPRFRGNPLVTGPPNIRFYAGVPLIESSGQAIGTLCVLDKNPRELPAEKLELLEALSRQAMAQLDLRRINNVLTREREALEADNERLGTLAATDGLTGLANRRRFDEALARFQKWVTLRGEPLSILLADVDEFKAYNDTYGHPAGDEVLKMMADLLRTNCRGRDLAARYGGEEFAVLLPNADIEAAKSAALRIHAAVRAHSWPRRPLSLSIGVATLSPGGCAEDLVGRADTALYRAKSSGRDRVIVADAMEPRFLGHRRHEAFDESLAHDASYLASA